MSLRTAERSRMPETAPPQISFFFNIPHHVPVPLHQVCTYQVLRCGITLHAESQLDIAQQRSAATCSVVRCGAVLCPALRCCVVLPCALFRTSSITGNETRCQVPSTGMYVLCTRLLLFLQLISFDPSILFPTQITPVVPVRT